MSLDDQRRLLLIGFGIPLLIIDQAGAIEFGAFIFQRIPIDVECTQFARDGSYIFRFSKGWGISPVNAHAALRRGGYIAVKDNEFVTLLLGPFNHAFAAIG